MGRYGRGNASQRGYGSRWRKARLTFLQQHPLCRMCQEDGRLTPATVVDHITPHKLEEARKSGSVEAIALAETMFWHRGNWQPLCKTHHDGAKAKQEARGYVVGCDESGLPLDPGHPWHR